MRMHVNRKHIHTSVKVDRQCTCLMVRDPLVRAYTHTYVRSKWPDNVHGKNTCILELELHTVATVGVSVTPILCMALILYIYIYIYTYTHTCVCTCPDSKQLRYSMHEYIC